MSLDRLAEMDMDLVTIKDSIFNLGYDMNIYSLRQPPTLYIFTKNYPEIWDSIFMKYVRKFKNLHFYPIFGQKYQALAYHSSL